jgi:hypothetical protein
MRISSGTFAATLAAITLLACAGCTDKLVGFRAVFSSNTLAVRAEAPSGDKLRFSVPKTTTDLSKRTIYLRPGDAILHLNGYLPVTANGVEETANGYVVTMTLPRDLVKHASGAMPNTVHVTGSLYIPADIGMRSFTGAELRVPTGARTLGATLDALHTGPMTQLAENVGSFLRGLYAAR